MKIFFLVLLLTACSTPEPLMPFEKEKDCSAASLKYLNTPSKPSAKKIPPIPNDKLYDRMLDLSDRAKDCVFNNNDFKNIKPMHICFVTGYDDKGKQEYFEFYTKAFKMNQKTTQCLNGLKSDKALAGLKYLKITQAFSYYADGTEYKNTVVPFEN